MNRKRLTILYLAAFWALAIGPAGPLGARDRIRILTSVFPLKEFAAAVAGDRGEVTLLLPPGAGVHTWQPRPADLVRLSRCELFIYIGANLEPWLPGLLKGLGGGRIPTLEASSGLALLASSSHEEGQGSEDRDHEAHGAFDPHIWLDFGLDGVIVDRIRDRLSSLDPEGTRLFEANALSLKTRLADLDALYRGRLAACPGRTILLAGHAAFGYLARRYGFEQVSLYGLSPDSQPTPSTLIKIVEDAQAKGIHTVFFETSISPDLATTLAREIGARTLILNPGHNLTRAEINRGVTFFDIMEENLRSLEDGLGCGPKR
jgi:zinc transport system substrate-binding protein